MIEYWKIMEVPIMCNGLQLEKGTLTHIKMLVFIFVVLLIFTSCKKEEIKDDSGSSSFKTSEIDKNINDSEKDSLIDNDNEIDFTKMNILGFEMLNRDDESYDEIISTFKIINNGTENINYFSVSFSYLDVDGNEICTDGRFNDCQLQSGKTAFMKTYSNLSGRDKSSIANINVTSYQYYIDEKCYEVNLQTESINYWENTQKSNVDFEKVNILEFNTTDKGVNSIGSREIEVQIKNNSTVPIAYTSYSMAYFDLDNNYLTTDGRYSDSLINPGNYVMSSSFCTDTEFANMVNTFGIFKYKYNLVENDENGYNYYEINLQTQTAIGSTK